MALVSGRPIRVRARPRFKFLKLWPAEFDLLWKGFVLFLSTFFVLVYLSFPVRMCQF